MDAEATALAQLLEGGPGQLPVVFSALSTFANALAEHLLREHHVIGTALDGANAPTDLDRAAFGQELHALRWDWEELLSGWDETAAAADYELFAEHLAALLGRIRRRIHTEEALLLK